MKKIVIAPHPDDEILGCGGYLLKSKSNNDLIAWLIVTGLNQNEGWSREKINSRSEEIEKIRKELGISEENIFKLNLFTSKLDQYPISKIVEQISDIFKKFQPEEILLPHPGDIHSDHRIVFEAGLSATKWFRCPNLRKVLTYETISETDFGYDPRYLPFKPNVFVDISEFLNKKIDLMKIYASEIGEFPFPRSEKSLKSQAILRGSQCGFNAAEAFYLVKEILN